jgi:hypothetical protein
VSDEFGIYRGKVKEGPGKNEWFYGNLVEELSTGKKFILDIAHMNSETKLFDLGFEVHPKTVGMWSTKTDKNGKRIFQGDKLSLFETPIYGKQTEFGEVVVKFGEYDDSSIEYGSEGIGWYVEGYHGYIRENGVIDKYPVGSDETHQDSLLRYLKWEITGTIHDTPGEGK